ncbi:hypothetical protein BLNAU_11511 [Blattamonas nauphoetae]|uniref:Uncharacterized protein n=1 Tax=Blattamonas nauphoetae TaxID=2049346 RepID=A0ABQ9XM87_9EUKA|nr:hypothetical protein BLNAU_11511 [Blattamonas nauphoetae]
MLLAEQTPQYPNLSRLCTDFFSQPSLRKPHHLSILREYSHAVFQMFDLLKRKLTGPASKFDILYILYQYCLIYNTDGHNINHLFLEFMITAIETKSYDLALPIAEHSVFAVDTVNVKGIPPTLTNIQVQQYFYYAGVVCAACKKFNSAVKLFNLGLSVPVPKPNIVQEAIWQKYNFCYMLAYRTSAPAPLFLVEPQYLAMITQNDLIQTLADYFNRPEASPNEMADLIETNRVKLKNISCYDHKIRFLRQVKPQCPIPLTTHQAQSQFSTGTFPISSPPKLINSVPSDKDMTAECLSLDEIRQLEHSQRMKEVAESKETSKLRSFFFHRLRMSKMPSVRKNHEHYGLSLSEYCSVVNPILEYSQSYHEPGINPQNSGHHTSPQPRSFVSYPSFLQDVRLPRPVLLRYASCQQLQTVLLGYNHVGPDRTHHLTPNRFSPSQSPNRFTLSPLNISFNPEKFPSPGQELNFISPDHSSVISD